MNKQKLEYMAHHISEVSDSDIVELKQLIATYPFYYLPHAVLAKIYFEREHYLFENALTQAAMRVKDREWLYHYIHSQQEILVPQKQNVMMSDDNQAEEVMSETEIEIKDTVIIEEATEAAENLKIETALINDVNAFLGEAEKSIEVEMPDEPVAVESEEDNEVQDEEIIEAVATDLEEISVVVEEQTTTAVSIESSEIEENSVTEEVPETVVENGEHSDLNIHEESTVLPDINLRKHPVYNVETFLDSEHKKAEKPAPADSNGAKDFFYWLNHPAPEPAVEFNDELKEENNEESGNDRMSIIDQFIKSNPSITRPKREFYNAENMAKRSENVALDFVSETLANIYYEQGNIDLAVKAYEKLSLQNPLKHAYFASLIEKIKKEKR